MSNAAQAARAARSDKKPGLMRETGEILLTVFYALLIAFVLRVVLFQPYTIPSASEEPNLYRGDYIIVSKWSYGWSQKSIPFLDQGTPMVHGRLLFTPPRRGDIIVFKLPHDGKTDYIKRLIGLPGDRIQMKDGFLYINGKKLLETSEGVLTTASRQGFPEPVSKVMETNPEGRTYLTQIYSRHEAADNTGVYVVPPHCYFMMGDNRDNSLDSRFDPQLIPGDPKLGGCGWDANLDNEGATSMNPGVGFVPEENLVGKAQIVLLSWDTGLDDSDTTKASIFKPWTWFTDARPSRFLHLLK